MGWFKDYSERHHRKVLNELRMDMQELLNEAYEKGVKQGYSEGHREGYLVGVEESRETLKLYDFKAAQMLSKISEDLKLKELNSEMKIKEIKKNGEVSYIASDVELMIKSTTVANKIICDKRLVKEIENIIKIYGR